MDKISVHADDGCKTVRVTHFPGDDALDKVDVSQVATDVGRVFHPKLSRKRYRCIAVDDNDYVMRQLGRRGAIVAVPMRLVQGFWVRED